MPPSFFSVVVSPLLFRTVDSSIFSAFSVGEHLGLRVRVSRFALALDEPDVGAERDQHERQQDQSKRRATSTASATR